jgi:hypothetical protein
MIMAELKQWHLDDEHSNVTGFISNSRDQKEYPEGSRFTILNVRITHYPEFMVLGKLNPEYWLARTALNNYFLLTKAERI